MKFYVGLHQPSDAQHFERCMVSVNRLRGRRSGFTVATWMLDSGAFTELSQHGAYRHDVADYAAEVNRWAGNGELVAAVAQDYMCEPFITTRTGLTVADHQRLTIERYDALRELVNGVYVMPVIQGYAPAEYAAHVHAYSRRLAHGAWVGVGSVCKRNADPQAIERVVEAIRSVRSDLRLHGFGVKLTTLSDPYIASLFASADSMAWSYAARKAGRNANDWREARRFVERVASVQDAPMQLRLGVAA